MVRFRMQHFPWIILIVAFAAALFSAWLEMRGAKREATRRDLGTFARLLTIYGIDNGGISQITLKQALTAAAEVRKRLSLSEERYRHIERDEDPWGHPFIYEWKNRWLVKIRSMGPNGRDDKGAGDDIQIIIDLEWVKKHEKPATSQPLTTQTAHQPP